MIVWRESSPENLVAGKCFGFNDEYRVKSRDPILPYHTKLLSSPEKSLSALGYKCPSIFFQTTALSTYLVLCISQDLLV